MKIRGKTPFIIAEMSGNHNGLLKRALEIVDAVADSGADALKLQTYTADTMTINLREKEFLIKNRDSLWKGYSLYDLYKKAHTPWEWHKAIFARCRQKGLIGFSTPFDESSVNFLESLHVPLYKIASFENTYQGLIRKVASTKKPMIISTGMATKAEIKDAVQWARTSGCPELVLLKCTSAYPASPKESNLKMITEMKKEFGCDIGLSDHTLGLGASIASVALGATVIERHVTLSRKKGGVDAAFSLEPDELKQLVKEVRTAAEAMGTIQYGPTPHEVPSLVFRRSLYIVRDVKKGEKLTPLNLRAIRPGFGLSAKFYSKMLGKKVRVDLKRGTALSSDAIES